MYDLVYMCAVTSAIKSADKSPTVTPPILRALMNLTDADKGGGSSSTNSQAIASFIKQYYNKADLEAFWSKYKISDKGNSFCGSVPSPCLSSHSVSPAREAFEGFHTPSCGIAWSTDIVCLVVGLLYRYCCRATSLPRNTRPQDLFSC